MSLTTISNQPVNFVTPEIYAKCRDTEPPLTVSENDPIIFQFKQSRCPDADQYLRKIGPADWSGEAGWTVAAGTLTLQTGNSGKRAQEDNFAAAVGTTYEVQVTISAVQGSGFRISVGGVDKVLNSLGVFAWVVTAETTGGAIVIAQGDNSSGVVSAFEVFQANESFEVAFIEGVTEVIYSPSSNPSYFTYAGEHVIFNGPLPDEMEDCFHVELRDQCTPYEVVYCSQSIKIIGCEGTILLRVCNDSDALGFAAGYFTLRQPATLGSPNWEYEEESERLSNGFINRFFIDRQEISVMSIERVSKFLHPFLAAMAMFDHFYIEQTEYSIDADSYQPGYGDSETGTGAVQLSVRPKQRLMRRVICDDLGAGCNPANDPICPQANATVGTEYSEGVLFAFVEVFSNLGFFVSEAQWYLNGLEQTSVLVAGTPGKYALGEVVPGDEVRVVFVDQQSLQQCEDDRGTFTVEEPPFCSGEGYATLVVADDGIGGIEHFVADSTSGYVAWRATDGSVTVHFSFDTIPLPLGTYCLYSSDEAGVASGEITVMEIIRGLSFVDYSSLTALTQLYLDNLPLVTALPSLDALTALERLYLDNLPLVTALPSLDALTGLEYLHLQNLPLVTTIPSLDTLTALEQLYLIDIPLVTTIPSLDALTALILLQLEDLPLVTAVDAHDHGQLSTVFFNSLPLMNVVDLSGCALVQSSTNSVLIALDANGLTDIVADLSGGTNAAPTGAGITAYNNLIAKGCTITTN